MEMTLVSNNEKISYQQNTTNTLSSGTNGSLPGYYHEEELKIHNRINNTAIGIIIAGFFMILGAFVYMIITGDYATGVISTVAGVITEYISGTTFKYVTKTSEDKWKYFNALSLNEEEKMLIQELREFANDEFKEKMLEKLFDTHCNMREK